MSGRSRDDVRFDVPAEVAFDFLVDPRNRSRWQSSLRRVEEVSPAEPVLGQTWIDVTAPGFRPAMETTVLDRPRRWTERGTWGPITAELTLMFVTGPEGCTVQPSFVLNGTGAGAFAARALALAAPFAVRSDLRRAARLLSRRGTSR